MEKQQLFNYTPSKAKRVVENVFGRLKTQFRIFGKGLKCDVRMPTVWFGRAALSTTFVNNLAIPVKLCGQKSGSRLKKSILSLLTQPWLVPYLAWLFRMP